MKLRDRLTSVSSEAAWIVAGQASGVIGQLLVVRTLTTELSAEEYGRFALALAAAGLATQSALAPSQGIIRFYSAAAERGELQGWATASLKIMTRSSTWAIGAGLVAALALSWLGHASWLTIAALCAGYCLVGGWGSTMSGIQVAARRRRVVAVHQGTEALLRAVLAMLLLPLLGPFGTTAALTYLIASIAVSASQVHWLRGLLPDIRLREWAATSSEWYREMWNFSWPFAVWGLFTWLQQSSDRYAVEWFADISQVGLYAVVFQLGYTPATLLSNALVSLVFPVIYQKIGDATDPHRVAKSRGLLVTLLGLSLAATVVATTTAILFHTQLFTLFAGPSFRQYSHLLPLTVLAGGLFSAGQIASLRLMSENRTRLLMAVKVSTAVAGIGANMVGAYIAGATGVVWALVLFAALYLLLISVCALIGADRSPPAVGGS